MKITNLPAQTDHTVQITLTTSEADSLAAVLHEHVIMGAVYAGHNGPIRRAYPYLMGLATTLCEQKDRV